MQLITLRLILRDFVEADCEAMLAYESKPLYPRYYESESGSEARVREFLGWFIAQQSDNPRYKFHMAVTLKASGKLIGNCNIRKVSADATNAEIGYEYDPDYWGQGYATEAARAVVAYGFDMMKVHHIWAHRVADNAGSLRVLEKLGMRQEARFKEEAYCKGRWWDKLIYAVLEPEWRAVSASKA